jgi:metallophosphoesterase (TIGR03767 family)
VKASHPRNHRSLILPAASLLVLSLPTGALSSSSTTLNRTIQDTDGDNLLEYAPGEPYIVVGADPGFRPPKKGSLLNFLQLSDFQMVDEESPARVEFLDRTQQPPANPFSAAYRPQESLTTQVTEAMVRTVRGQVSPVTGQPLDLTILTGDNADSQQYNETRWFIDILDGGKTIRPDSGVSSPACPHREPGSVYDGVQGGGEYYDPDASGPGTDGRGYSPNRAENAATTGRDVTVRDFPGLFEAANKPFQAAGLRTPWYTAFGNHDALVQGNSPDAYTGPFGPVEAWLPGQNTAYHQVATGCAKPTTGSTDSFIGNPAVNPLIVPPDQRRCFLAKDRPLSSPPGPCHDTSWIQQHFVTAGSPRGHGFASTSTLPRHQRQAGYGRPASAVLDHDGYYSFSPTDGFRFVVLDTVTDECGSIFCSEGSVDEAQFRWLESQILQAASLGQYVLVFSHHTLRTTRFPSSDGTEQPLHHGQRLDRENPANPQATSPAPTLEELFCQHTNLLAHVAGHEHENYVRHHTCAAEVTAPTPGPGDFWEIGTAAHIDWPQQSRMIEFIDNGNKTMSMVLTILDHGGPPRPSTNPGGVTNLASIARELAYNDYQNSRGSRGSPEDRNLIIVLDRPAPQEDGDHDDDHEDDDDDEDDDDRDGDD